MWPWSDDDRVPSPVFFFFCVRNFKNNKVAMSDKDPTPAERKYLNKKKSVLSRVQSHLIGTLKTGDPTVNGEGIYTMSKKAVRQFVDDCGKEMAEDGTPLMKCNPESTVAEYACPTPADDSTKGKFVKYDESTDTHYNCKLPGDRGTVRKEYADYEAYYPQIKKKLAAFVKEQKQKIYGKTCAAHLKPDNCMMPNENDQVKCAWNKNNCVPSTGELIDDIKKFRNKVATLTKIDKKTAAHQELLALYEKKLAEKEEKYRASIFTPGVYSKLDTYCMNKTPNQYSESAKCIDDAVCRAINLDTGKEHDKADMNRAQCVSKEGMFKSHLYQADTKAMYRLPNETAVMMPPDVQENMKKLFFEFKQAGENLVFRHKLLNGNPDPKPKVVKKFELAKRHFLQVSDKCMKTELRDEIYDILTALYRSGNSDASILWSLAGIDTFEIPRLLDELSEAVRQRTLKIRSGRHILHGTQDDRKKISIDEDLMAFQITATAHRSSDVKVSGFLANDGKCKREENSTLIRARKFGFELIADSEEYTLTKKQVIIALMLYNEKNGAALETARVLTILESPETLATECIKGVQQYLLIDDIYEEIKILIDFRKKCRVYGIKTIDDKGELRKLFGDGVNTVQSEITRRFNEAKQAPQATTLLALKDLHSKITGVKLKKDLAKLSDIVLGRSPDVTKITNLEAGTQITDPATLKRAIEKLEWDKSACGLCRHMLKKYVVRNENSRIIPKMAHDLYDAVTTGKVETLNFFGQPDSTGPPVIPQPTLFAGGSRASVDDHSLLSTRVAGVPPSGYEYADVSSDESTEHSLTSTTVPGAPPTGWEYASTGSSSTGSSSTGSTSSFNATRYYEEAYPYTGFMDDRSVGTLN